MERIIPIRWYKWILLFLSVLSLITLINTVLNLRSYHSAAEATLAIGGYDGLFVGFFISFILVQIFESLRDRKILKRRKESMNQSNQ